MMWPIFPEIGQKETRRWGQAEFEMNKNRTPPSCARSAMASSERGRLQLPQYPPRDRPAVVILLRDKPDAPQHLCRPERSQLSEHRRVVQPPDLALQRANRPIVAVLAGE
jgi:hypothetical protein